MSITPVSVILPAFNAATTLAEAARSVLAQTYPQFELLILDDGSSDGTADVARTFLADDRVRFHPRPHEGQSAVKNFGILTAQHPLIAFIDADDLWHPEKLARQVAVMAARPEAVLVHTRRLLLRGEERTPDRAPAPPTGNVLPHLLRDNFVCFSSVMLRKWVLEYAGIFSPEIGLSIDYELWLRVAAHGTFEFIDEPLVEYRTGHENLSARTYDRLTTALTVLQRFVHDRGGASRVPADVVTGALRHTYRSFALCSAPSSPRRHLGWLARLAAWPAEWLFVARCLVRAGLRRLGLFRVPAWEAGYRHPANHPDNW